MSKYLNRPDTVQTQWSTDNFWYMVRLCRSLVPLLQSELVELVLFFSRTHYCSDPLISPSKCFGHDVGGCGGQLQLNPRQCQRRREVAVVAVHLGGTAPSSDPNTLQ
jgi:hypothetical protein